MTEQRRGPQRRANLIQSMHVEGDTVRLEMLPTRRQFESAYVRFTLGDSTEPQENIAIPYGRIPREIIVPRPAEIFSMRLVTRQEIRGRNVINVQPGAFDGNETLLVPEGWQLPDTPLT